MTALLPPRSPDPGRSPVRDGATASPARGPVLARDVHVGDHIDGRLVTGIIVYDRDAGPRFDTYAEVTFTDGTRQTWPWLTPLHIERAT